MKMHIKIQKISLLVLCFSFLSHISFGQDIWKSVQNVKNGLLPSEVVSYVTEYNTLQVDYEALVKGLQKAPAEFKKRGQKMSFPMPDGTMKEFEVFESPIMAEGLQAKYPSIKDYKIISTDGYKASGRIGVNYNGFHASIRTPEGQIYIDPYGDDQVEYYASYYTKNYSKTMENLPSCGVSGEDSDALLDGLDLDNIDIPSKNIQTRSPEGEVSLRTYRCAIACTGEFGQTKGGTIEAVLSVMNTSVNRINEIFEYEVAIRMILIDESDEIIHLNANTDPYVNSNEGASLIGQNTNAISNIIGFGAFDIGHVYTNGCSDVGGIASLQSVCGASKGNGVTCHYSSNVDIISVRVACHEMGHQFGATHSFNNCDEDNESTATAYEPGSGWTIMSYAGGCGSAKNVANAPFEYYHGINIEQMSEFSREGNGNSCATLIETDNVHPVVDHKYTDGFSIPIETPFKLEGSATDENGDALTYSWEEFDLGPLSLPGSPIGDAPQFVSDVPHPENYRYLPNIVSIVTNQTDKREVLPFFEKDMTWRLTVRDNNDDAGGAEWKEVQFFASESAGPFKVEYPSNPQNFIAGNEEVVTWDVSNTDNDIVNCQFVDILLSVDGGYTYPVTLKSFTPNDGSEPIIIPNIETDIARVMVKASENIFFDISNLNSKIAPPTVAGYSAVVVPGYQAVCLPASPEVVINTEQFLDFNTPISLEIIEGLPQGTNVSFTENPVNAGENTTLIFDATDVLLSGPFDVKIRAVAGEDTVLLNTIIDLTSSDYSDLATVSPATGESGIGATPIFEWVADTDAESYIFQLSDDPSFVNGDININKAGLTDNNYQITVPLLKNKIYFWRITGVNKCGEGVSTALSTFASEALSCKTYAESAVPINLPSSGTPTTNLETVIVANGVVSDVSVRKLKGTHQNFKQLRAKLISPLGTEVMLFDKRCAGATSFNCAFDDNSPAEIQCPMINSATFIPEGDLTAFNGEELFGKWILAIEDTQTGQGGKVDEYVLDVCSNASLSNPELVKNNKLFLGPGQTDLINSGRLLVEDEDNDEDELTYTLVEIPEFGELRLFGSAMSVGDKFNQEDLTLNRISYRHTSGASSEDDKFVFVVDDSEGGWIDLTTFDISIDVASKIDTYTFDYFVSIYPNPANKQVNLEISDASVKSFEIEVTDVLGRKIDSRSVQGNQFSYNIDNYNSGTYFFKISINQSSKVFKVQVQK